jgi:predicted ATPase
VTLYGGDLLPSCYDDWIRPERERLSQAFAGTLEQLVLLLEDQRAYRAAIGHARRLLQRDPLHEGTCRRLMRLHALTGDRAAALRVYHACATGLERELGMEPSSATREAYQRLLKAETVDVPPPTPGAELAAASPLVGRHREWARLGEAWRAARAGRPHFVLLTGDSGIGKTRLAEEMVQWARRQGIATASARCYAGGGELVYGPVASWLRARPLPTLEPVWRSEIARILPELLAEQPDLPPPKPLTEAWQRQRFFEALKRAILRGSPSVLLIDALQWCDRGTLEWLRYLLRADAGQPSDPPARLLIIGTCRPAEIGDEHPLTSLLQALRRDGQLTEIALGPLDEAGTAELAANVAGREPDPDLAACLYRETEGNPLFVVETVRMGLLATEQERGRWDGEWRTVCLPRPLPSQMQAAIEARLAQLTPPARELADVAATIGRQFTFAVLIRASRLDEDVLVQAVDELWRRRIVCEQGADAYDFGHDKLREVAYGGLSAARKRWLHRRVAQALEDVHASDLDAVSGQVAAHYERADEPQHAIPYYHRAALAARRIHANEEATRYLRRALALLEAVPPSDTAPRWRREMEAKLREGLGSVTDTT